MPEKEEKKEQKQKLICDVTMMKKRKPKKKCKKPNQRDNLTVENAWKQNWKEMDLNERGVYHH